MNKPRRGIRLEPRAVNYVRIQNTAYRNQGSMSHLRADIFRDLTQKYVAALIGTTQQYYSEYERGVREIPLHSFIKLARFYSVSLETLAENAEKIK